ncbi:MAG: hypothetical protein STSR0008_21840 [Ignavibacterium sp.]
MIKYKYLFGFILSISLFLFSCSSTKEEVKEENQNDVYVFDEVPNDSLNTEQIEKVGEEVSINSKSFWYVVQIGAFTTEEKANNFADYSREKLNREIDISFSNDVGLFVVQLKPFQTRKEAETVRNQVWQMSDYKDAFILTIYK